MFQHDIRKASQQKTTWRTSIRGKEAAKRQVGLGRDRFGLTIKESKMFGKGIRYKGNVGVTIDIFGSKKRPLLKPKGVTLFPKDKYAVHYLDKAGNVKGLIERQSKVGGWIASKTTKDIGRIAATGGKAVGKLATGLSGVGTAWMAYDTMKWAQQWHEENPGAVLKLKEEAKFQPGSAGKYGVDY